MGMRFVQVLVSWKYEGQTKTTLATGRLFTSGKLEISDQETKIFGHHSVFQGINDQN